MGLIVQQHRSIFRPLFPEDSMDHDHSGLADSQTAAGLYKMVHFSELSHPVLTCSS
jgi:hypothetical protein